MRIPPEKYQGWSTYETWAVKLHWDNTQAVVDDIICRAQTLRKKDNGLHAFAQWLKQRAEDIFHTVIFTSEATREERMFVSDVGSLFRVDWKEIATAYWVESYAHNEVSHEILET